MRVLQLIDSLHTGGAERVAVNIANALIPNIEGSYLCATREEGLLQNSINTKVNYLFLNKKKTIDFKAIRKLNRYVKQNKIGIIHAHSTSFFLATVLKIMNRKIKIVWHDHYGNSEFLENRSFKMLKKCSKSFSKIYSVNKELESWAIKNLSCKNVSYLPNFAVENPVDSQTYLKGIKGKRIIHLANLRVQKDHLTLFNAFSEVVKQDPDWTLHCVGKDFEDDYAKTIRKKIKALKLEDSIFIYGSKPDVSAILKQSDIAVLSSKSEGLPIALLEYGLAGLPAIATNVGECATVLLNGEVGSLVPSNNSGLLAKAILVYVNNPKIAKEHGSALNKHVNTYYSSQAVIGTLIENYKNIVEYK